MKQWMAKTRAIRLTEKEEKQIRKFLEQNPMFDFSTLARVSISQFIENPQLKLKPVRKAKITREVTL